MPANPATSFRFTILGEPIGPWRATREEAWADAIDEGLGNFDDYTDRVWVTVPGAIWLTLDEVDTVPREPARRPASVTPIRKATSYPEGLSRIDRIIARREGRLGTPRAMAG